MEDLGICEICKMREGSTFDELERWICTECDFDNSYPELEEEDYEYLEFLK